MSNAIAVNFLNPEGKRRIFKVFNIIVLLSLLVNIPLGIAGAGVFFDAKTAIAISGADKECADYGLGVGVAKWEWSESEERYIPEGDPNNTSVTGDNLTANWSASSSASGVLRKAATEFVIFPGGTYGMIEAGDNAISHLTICEGRCEMELIKTARASSTSPGAELTYDLKLENVGSANCTGGGVKLRDMFDENTAYISSDPTPETVKEEYVEWNFGTLEPGEVEEVVLTVHVGEWEECVCTIINKAKFWSDQTGWGEEVVVDTPISCEEPVCGDGIVNQDFEQCDDGNLINGDGCDATCQNECIDPVCGNGVLEEGEECDDGNLKNGDGCDSSCNNECVEPVCGNGIIEGDEECDDGNLVDGDGCDSVCNTENVLKKGTLIVTKTVEGSMASSSDWTMHIGDAASFPGSASGTATVLNTGMYQVTETGEMDNYELSFGGDCGEEGHVTVVANDTRECILTNTFIPQNPATSSITVCKYIDEDGLASTTEDREMATSSSWTFVLENGESTTTKETLEGCASFESLDAGVYNIKEVIPSGWALVEPEVNLMVVVLGERENATVNFVNSEVIIKPFCGDNINNQESEACDDGPDGSSTCTTECKTISTPEPRCGDSVLDDGEQCDDGNTVNNDGCSSTCARESGGGGGGLIITNRGGSVVSDTPVVVTGIPVMAIEKSVDQLFANAGDKGIKYKIVIANNSNSTLLNVSVVDDLPTGLSYNGTDISTKIWNLGNLEGGKFKTLDFLVDIDYNTIAGNYENIATVSADNHDSVSDTAMLEVRTVETLGVERLPETGFSVNEMVYLLISLLVLLGVSSVARSRTMLRS